MSSLSQLSAPQVVRLVGHELRNRLGVLSNSVYYLHLRLGDEDEKLVRHLGLISQEIAATNRILANLMDWIGPKEPTFERLHLNVLVEQLCTRTQPQEGLEITLSLADDLPLVYADVAQLERALGNLLAYEYALLHEGGGLEIVTRHEDGWAGLYLRDSEPCFTPDQAAGLLTVLPDDRFSPVQLDLLVAGSLLAANRCRLAVADSSDLPWRFRILIPILQQGLGGGGVGQDSAL